MYEMKIRVRYSEVDQKGKVRLHQLLEYFQDCVTFHSIAVGLGLRGDVEENQNRAWYLIAWDIQIYRLPKLVENLTVITEPYKMRGFYGYRRYRILDESQNIVVDADSNWIFMDTEKMIPMKIPQYLTDRYITGKVDQIVRVKRKLSSEGQWTERETMEVTKIFLDSNGHVNNTYYVLWAEDVLPEGYEVKEIRVDYRQSSYLHDILRVYSIEEDGKWRIRFLNQNDEIVALIELTGSMRNHPETE